MPQGFKRTDSYELLKEDQIPSLKEREIQRVIDSCGVSRHLLQPCYCHIIGIRTYNRLLVERRNRCIDTGNRDILVSKAGLPKAGPH